MQYNKKLFFGTVIYKLVGVIQYIDVGVGKTSQREKY